VRGTSSRALPIVLTSIHPIVYSTPPSRPTSVVQRQGVKPCSIALLPKSTYKTKGTRSRMAQTDGTGLRGNRDWTVPLWRDGQQVSTVNSFHVISPLTDEVLYRSSAASTDDALAAVAVAERAFPAWSSTKPGHRRDLFLRAAEELVRRKDDLWHFCSKETGSTEPYFEFDFNDALESLKSCAGLIATVQGSVPQILVEDRSAMVVKEPYGVVVSIAPWNAPCILGLRSFLAPLASECIAQSLVETVELITCSGQYCSSQGARASSWLLLDSGRYIPSGWLASRLP